MVWPGLVQSVSGQALTPRSAVCGDAECVNLYLNEGKCRTLRNSFYLQNVNVDYAMILHIKDEVFHDHD